MDKTFWMNLLAYALETLIPIALVAVGILIRNAVKKAGATKEQLALIDGAYEILARAARKTNQIWVEALKLAQGGLTEEQAAQARAMTTETFKEMITEAMQFAIEQAYGSLEKWIEMNLESAVNEVKDIYVPLTEIAEEEGNKELGE